MPPGRAGETDKIAIRKARRRAWGGVDSAAWVPVLGNRAGVQAREGERGKARGEEGGSSEGGARWRRGRRPAGRREGCL